MLYALKMSVIIQFCTNCTNKLFVKITKPDSEITKEKITDLVTLV